MPCAGFIQPSAAIVDRLVARLKEHDAGEDAPKPGDEMPPFVLPDENGRLVGLKDLLAKGPAVVTFHRGHWCPYCRISINTLGRRSHASRRSAPAWSRSCRTASSSPPR